MDPRQLEEEIQKIVAEANRKQKIQSFWDLAFFLGLLFLLIGALMPSHREQAAFGMVFFVMCWITNQVFSRGFAAIGFLFTKNPLNNDKKDE